MFILEKSKIKLSIYGSEYEISKPTYGQTQNLQERLKTEGEKESMKIMRDFVISLGLPEDVLNNLELDHFLALIEHISGAKKNLPEKATN